MVRAPQGPSEEKTRWLTSRTRRPRKSRRSASTTRSGGALGRVRAGAVRRVTSRDGRAPPGLRAPGRRAGRERPVQVAHGREARPRRRGRDRGDRRRQAVRPDADPQRPQPRLPRRPDLDGPRPVGNGQVRAHQAHRRPALPGLRRPPRPRRVGARDVGRRAVRDAQEVRPPVPGRGAVRLDEHLGQRRLPAAPAHGQVRGRKSARSSTAASTRSACSRRPTRCRTSSRAGCASAPASPGRWCSILRS